jgi:hypothetical protein
MDAKYYTSALLGAALAAATALTACGSGGNNSSTASSSSPAGAAASPQASSAKTVAVTQQDDSNWAGYVAANSTTTTTRFSSVSGSWTQPSADCGSGSPSYSAFWIGLGGYTGQHLEQIGTSADCSANGSAVYSAWYELVPAAQVAVSMTVKPGDHLSARVAVSGTTVSLSMSDLTRHATFSKQLQMSSPSLTSAEWIAEAPSQCASSAGASSAEDCRILSLADFGSVSFTDASASAGQSGSIASGLGTVAALTLEANPEYGRLYRTAAQAEASPSPLSGNGSSFTVRWNRPAVQITVPPFSPAGPFYH